MNRRNFLKALSVLAATPLAEKAFGLQPDYKKNHENTSYIVWGSGLNINRINLKSFQKDTQHIKTLCHGFINVPNEPDQIITVEKWRSRICKVDFKNSKNTVRVFSARNSRFYGHACALPDGKNFATIIVNHETKLTSLAIYDFKTLKLTEEHIIGRGGAHEMALLPDNKTLVIAMTGWIPLVNDRTYTTSVFKRVGNSSLLYFDLNTKKVVNNIELKNERLSLAHLKLDNFGNVYALSDIMYEGLGKLGSGGVHRVSSSQDKIIDFDIPTELYVKMKGEFLSLDPNPKQNLLAATNPHGGYVVIFDTKTNQTLYTLNTNTTGVAWSADGGTLYILNRNTHSGYEPIFTPLNTDVSNLFNVKQFYDISDTVGSHMLRYDI